MICNLGVVGSNPTRGSKAGIGNEDMGVFQSGQMGQTVNLLSFDFGGSNPSAPTLKGCFAELSASRMQKIAFAEAKPKCRFAEIAQLIEH